jgi:hypothetical protein
MTLNDFQFASYLYSYYVPVPFRTHTVGTCQYSVPTIYGYPYSFDPDPALSAEYRFGSGSRVLMSKN